MRFFHLVALGSSMLASMALAGDNPYITMQVIDATNFCTFLPPPDSPNQNIAETEYMANVQCMGNTPKATPVKQLPDGFIQSAHFVATDDYVQITGQIDPTKAGLDPNDEGGQYDIAMPREAICVGWKHFVNLIEPAGRTYCIRCCHSKQYCNRGISEKGCAHIIPGDYSGPMDGSGAALPQPSSSSGSPSSSSSSSTPSASPTSSNNNASASKSPATAASPPASSSVNASAAAASSSAAASNASVSPAASSSSSSSSSDPAESDTEVSAQSLDGNTSGAITVSAPIAMVICTLATVGATMIL